MPANVDGPATFELVVKHLHTARRLSPVVTVRDLAFLPLAQFMNRNYQEMVRVNEERRRRFPGRNSDTSRVVLAAAYALLDQPAEAAATVKDLLDAQPDFNLSQWRYINSWVPEDYRTRLYEAAKKAGVPEYPPKSSQ